MSLAVVKSRQVPWHRAIVAGAEKITAGVPYGATLFEYVAGSSPPIGSWWVFTEAGWVPESVPGLATVYIHTITPTIVDPAAAQTDVVTIDGVACSFTSDATPTAAEIVTGLKAAIAASTAVGKFVVTGTTTLILTPATSYSPVVAVSANLTDVLTIGVPVMGSFSGTITAALPAGTNNIGDVDVLSMPPNTLVSETVTALAGTVVITLPNGCGSVALQVAGTWVGQLEFEGSIDGTNYQSVEASNGISVVNATAGNDIFILPGAGYAKVRVRASAWTSGTATITFIGSVGTAASILTGSLPAGTNNIGDVDVATIAAGETHIGEVGGNTLPVVVTPVIGAAAFTAGDFVGGKLTLANAGRVAGGTGIIQNLSIVDAAKQAAALRIYLFKADLAGTYADNAVESFTAADLLNLIDVIDVQAGTTDWETLANASVTKTDSLRGLGIPYKITTGTSLFAIIRALGTPTFTANCLQLTFGLLRD